MSSMSILFVFHTTSITFTSTDTDIAMIVVSTHKVFY